MMDVNKEADALAGTLKWLEQNAPADCIPKIRAVTKYAFWIGRAFQKYEAEENERIMKDEDCCVSK